MKDIDIVRLTRASQLDNTDPDVFDGPIITEFLEAFLTDPRHLMFVAQEGSLVVGMVSAVEYFHPDKPTQLWINEIGVADAYRNRGIGRRLMSTLLNEASQRGIAYAWLGTACFQSVTGTRPTQPFLLYEWDIGSS